MLIADVLKFERQARQVIQGAIPLAQDAQRIAGQVVGYLGEFATDVVSDVMPSDDDVTEPDKVAKPDGVPTKWAKTEPGEENVSTVDLIAPYVAKETPRIEAAWLPREISAVKLNEIMNWCDGTQAITEANGLIGITHKGDLIPLGVMIAKNADGRVDHYSLTEFAKIYKPVV